MPGDDATTGPFGTNSVMATFLAEDWVSERADFQRLITEAEELLTAVDLAISGKDFGDDKNGKQMQISWAFLGPGLSRRIQVIKLTSRDRPDYAQLAVVTMALTLRRQTLELNNIEVLNKV